LLLEAGVVDDAAVPGRPSCPRQQQFSPPPDGHLADTVDPGGTGRAAGEVPPVTVSLAAAAAAGRPDSGLGFDVTGDPSGAVFVREVFDRGPASHTGKIRPGETMPPGEQR